jgi:uncharacterized membrane protein
MDDRDRMAACMAATVAWNMYGFATGAFQRYWPDARIPVTTPSYLLNAAIVLSLPATRSTHPVAIRQATTLGALMALWSAAGVYLLPSNKDRLSATLPLPARYVVAIPAVLGALTALFGLRAAADLKQP